MLNKGVFDISIVFFMFIFLIIIEFMAGLFRTLLINRGVLGIYRIRFLYACHA